MLARKKWAKFGDAQRYKPGDESMTAVSIEEIFLERARATRGYVIRHLDPYHYTVVSLPLFPGRGPLDS